MCNCMNEKTKKLQELLGAEDVTAPVEMLSGRAYLSFDVKMADKKKSKSVPMLLSKCPFCGKLYEESEVE